MFICVHIQSYVFKTVWLIHKRFLHRLTKVVYILNQKQNLKYLGYIFIDMAADSPVPVLSGTHSIDQPHIVSIRPGWAHSQRRVGVNITIPLHWLSCEWMFDSPNFPSLCLLSAMISFQTCSNKCILYVLSFHKCIKIKYKTVSMYGVFLWLVQSSSRWNIIHSHHNYHVQLLSVRVGKFCHPARSR